MAREYSQLSHRVGRARAPAWAICEAARDRVGRGEDLIMMGAGIPDMPSPPAALDACLRSLATGRTRYPTPQGEPGLRYALARRHADATGLGTLAADVVVTAGAQAGVLAALQALAGAGTGVATLVPYYPAYGSAIAAVDGRLVQIHLDRDRGYAFDPAAAGSLDEDTRVLLLTSPHNPTGRVFSDAELDALCALCIERDLWLVCDEVYAGLAYDGRHVSPAGRPGMEGRTFTVGSFSKTHSMSGWRCGWIVAPPGAGGLVQSVVAAGSLGVPPFVQDAAQAAIEAGDGAVASMRGEYRRRRDVLLSGLARIAGLRAVAPEAGMFVMLDVSGAGWDGGAFAWRLLENGVCVIPGEAFGAACSGSVRIGLSEPVERIRLACAAIALTAAEGGRSPAVRVSLPGLPSTRGETCIPSTRPSQPRP